MIPNNKDRELSSLGVAESSAFEISLEDSAHIMTILRDTLYSDKILAVLREYSSNAWDAHRAVGKHDVPIEVTIPTDLDPTLTIRDFGPGLSREDAFRVYTKYGKSTKRLSDDVVGTLGIGAKSGFAYSDSFTVTSWNGGVKSVYVAVLDKTDKGVLNLLHEEPCGDETGLMIQLAVKPQDIPEFTSKARRLFQFFQPIPKINIEVENLYASGRTLPSGTVFASFGGPGGWLATMGCIPYRINLDQLRGVGNGLGDNLFRLTGVLNFNIGEVQINASREELKYTDSTKQALVDRLENIVDEYVHSVLKEVEALDLTPWEKRKQLKVLRDMRIDVPEGSKDLLSLSVSLKEHPPSFYFTHKRKDEVDSLSISEDSRILLKDTNRAIAGYTIGYHNYVLRRKSNQSWDTINAELEEYLKKLNIFGIPILKLSDQPWSNPRGYTGSGSTFNIKHRHKVFEMNPQRFRDSNPYSTNWLSSSKTKGLDPDDVFVVISDFKTNFRLEQKFFEDRKLFEYLKVPIPTIYGIKSTEKHPVLEKDVAGIEYRAWRSKIIESLMTDQNKQAIESYGWYGYNPFGHAVHHITRTRDVLLSIVELLGQGHPFSEFLVKAFDEYRRVSDMDSIERGALSHLLYLAGHHFGTLEVKKCTNQLAERYPLIFLRQVGIDELFGTDRKAWIKYIQLVDAVEAQKEKDNGSSVHDDERIDHSGVAGEESDSAEGSVELSGTQECAAE